MAASTTRPAQIVAAGPALRFEDLGAGAVTPRMRTAEHTLLRVVSGSVCLAVRGTVRLLAVGEEAIVAAGDAHTIESFGGPARVLYGFTRAR